jgi:4,5-DOPA dioxygenase extradiol
MISSLFIGHGSPMVAIEDSEYARFLDSLGRTLPRPTAVVVFSAHWESNVQMVSEIDEYSMIYDFGGFPEELYRMVYPAKGDIELSRRIQALLADAGIPYRAEKKRGLDHGSWTILHRIYPQADIPVIAMSVNPYLTHEEQYAIGKALSPLREQDVLIIGSGATVHNFGLFGVRDREAVKALCFQFESWLAEHLKKWDLNSLFRYEELAPYGKIAVPPRAREHFVPVFYAMGAADQTRTAVTLHQSLLMDVFINSAYQFG